MGVMFCCEVVNNVLVIDGAAIAGLERTAVYEEQEVEKDNKEENDSILKMLMKSGNV